MSPPRFDAPFSSYGPGTTPVATAMPGTIRVPEVNTPLRRSVFELRPRDLNHGHRNARNYQGPLCQHPAPTLRFRVTAPGPRPWPPPCPELSGSPMSTPRYDAPISSYGPGTATMATAMPGTITVPYVNTPLRRSDFELRPRDRDHGHRHARNYQCPLCQHPAPTLRFRVTAPGPRPWPPPCPKLQPLLFSCWSCSKYMYAYVFIQFGPWSLCPLPQGHKTGIGLIYGIGASSVPSMSPVAFVVFILEAFKV